jgi:hypothetical protein
VKGVPRFLRNVMVGSQISSQESVLGRCRFFEKDRFVIDLIAV